MLVGPTSASTLDSIASEMLLSRSKAHTTNSLSGASASMPRARAWPYAPHHQNTTPHHTPSQ
jgi:hypothetical protein